MTWKLLPVTFGVVIPCHRQERFLPRTVAALERALEGHEWRGALVMAAPDHEPLPALSERWHRIAAPAEGRPSQPPGVPARPLTPGAARMLGFAACGGDWVLFVDADVEVDAAWVAAAHQALSESPMLGGLWGRLEEWFVADDGERPGRPDLYGVGEETRRTDYMATLAFYRREALRRAGGYDPRLSSEEDFELGLRCAALGLELRSLGQRAGRHWSEPRPSFAELGRRWRTGLCFGQGQVLRLYAGRRGFGVLLRRQRLYFATLALWGLGLLALGVSLAQGSARALALWALLPLAALLAMSARKRSLRLGAHAVLSWTVNAFGMVVGLVRGGGRATALARDVPC